MMSRHSARCENPNAVLTCVLPFLTTKGTRALEKKEIEQTGIKTCSAILRCLANMSEYITVNLLANAV